MASLFTGMCVNSEEYKNRLVHVAKSSQIFPFNCVLHTYPPKGFCHLKRCGNKWDLTIQILVLILPGFILFLFPLLVLWSGQGFVMPSPSWYSLLGLIEYCRLLCTNLLSATGTAEERGSGLQEVKPPWHARCCLTQTVQKLYIADANPSVAPPWHRQACKWNLPLFWLNSRYRQSCW